MANSLQLYRTLPLNDAENTQLFTFKLGLMNLDEFKSRSVRSTIINYQGQDWYLSCKYAEGKRHEFLGVYIYWGSPSEGVRCRADFRIITRNIVDPTKSLVTEGSQVEFSAPQSPGWGKREFASLRELFTPGQGFLLEPEKIVIIELAMKSCSTLFEQSVDFTQLLSHREQPYPSFFTSNFPLAGMEFYVSLYPLGDREEADGHVSMYLHRFLGNEGDTSIIGCRIRYRFFLGHSRTCPTSSKTFEFSFKNEQGYGRFKAFEPLDGSDNLLYRGAVPLGVEVVSITPFAQPEIRLTTRGYYHTDNFVFEDAVFPDHRGNQWRLSAASGTPYLSLRLNAEDKNRLFSAPGLTPTQSRLTKREECTKFIQWRAFVLSRTDRKKTLAVNGCPLSAYYSRGLMQTNYSMSTQIPLIKAKSLDGDYCTKEEPSLLVRIEFLNVQDIACVMTDYPTLDFERFQLYHTREGLKRCLKQNDALVKEMEALKAKLNSAVKDSKDSRDLVNDFHRLIKHPIPPLSHNQDSGRNAQLMNWLLQQDSIPSNKNESPGDATKQLSTPSARPASISSSPTLSVQPPVPRPRGVRGPPPRPPPRAYSPVATDLVSTRQFTYTPTSPTEANSLASPPPPPLSHSAGFAMASDQQRLAVLNSNDTAFKRFSFTGINVTPAMISSQASETVRNVDVPAQSSSMGKEPTSPKGSAPLHNGKPASTPTSLISSSSSNAPSSTASSVVMSKLGNDGASRGFALARMTQRNVHSPQPLANQTTPQQLLINQTTPQPQQPQSSQRPQSQQPQPQASQHPQSQQPQPQSPKPQPLMDQPIRWPAGMTPPSTAHISHSTGELTGRISNQQSPKHISNGDVGLDNEVQGGFQTTLLQSISNPNISTHSGLNGQTLSGKTNSPLKTSQVTSNQHSLNNPASNAPQRPLSMNLSKGFEFSPVPRSVVNRRSPVPESMSQQNAAMHKNGQANADLAPTSPPPVATTDQTSMISMNMESRNAKSTPTTPNKSNRKPGVPLSKSTPSSPTKQPPHHTQQQGQQFQANLRLQQSQQQHQQSTSPPLYNHVEQYPQKPQASPQLQEAQTLHQQEISPQPRGADYETRLGLSQSSAKQQVSVEHLTNNISNGQHNGSKPLEIASHPMPNTNGNGIAGRDSLINGTDQNDSRRDRPQSEVQNIRPEKTESQVEDMKQINFNPVGESNEHWSLPSIEQRRHMGVIETSL